jgi:hypothetical protein
MDRGHHFVFYEEEIVYKINLIACFYIIEKRLDPLKSKRFIGYFPIMLPLESEVYSSGKIRQI